MPGISAIVITFNEEKNIERCLDSLVRIADEIIVIDSYSTDNTAKLCAKYNVKFIRNSFKGYIQQKNFAVSQTTFPIVLSLDADEALSGELQESILNVRGNLKFDGYYCNRINNYCGKWIKHTSWYPDKKLRLWDKSKGVMAGLNPHDRVELKDGSITTFLPGNIEHYPYSSVSEHILKVNRFTDIAAFSYYSNGISSGYHKIMVYPIWKFVREMILKKGIFGGYYGFIISSIMAFEVFLKYVKLKQLHKEGKGPV